jgi:predicted dehydrogenase
MEYDLDLDPEKAIYTHARAISMHPAFELLAAVDPIRQKRDIFTEHFQLPAFTNVREALGKVSPTVIIIASPTVSHVELVIEVLELCHPKIILCEKPLAYDLGDARNLVELCKNAGVKLFVNYIRRSDPGAIDVKKRLVNYFDKPVKGIAWYSKGFIHNGSHLFNLLEFWLGKYVQATVINDGRLWQEHDTEPDVQVQFEHGTVLFFAAWEEIFSHYTIELLGSWGLLRYERGGEYITWLDTQDNKETKGYTFLKTTPEIILNRMNYYQLSVFEQIAEEMLGRKTSLCTGEEALGTLEAINSIIKLRKT